MIVRHRKGQPLDVAPELYNYARPWVFTTGPMCRFLPISAQITLSERLQGKLRPGASSDGMTVAHLRYMRKMDGKWHRHSDGCGRRLYGLFQSLCSYTRGGSAQLM
jgi:hypothetical protein